MIKAQVNLGIEGIIHKVEKKDATTGEVTQVLGPFRNLLTDAGLNRINTSTDYNELLNEIGVRRRESNGLSVGTGTSEPDVSDTSLDQFLYHSRDQDSEEGGSVVINDDLGYSFYRGTFVFREDEAVGNLTELGLNVERGSFDDFEDGGTLTTRQLFKDEQGDPTTITKLETEILFITYEVRLYHDLTATGNITSGQVTLNNVTYDYELGPINLVEGSNNNRGSLWGGADTWLVIGNGLAVQDRNDDIASPDWKQWKTDWLGSSLSGRVNTTDGTISVVTIDGEPFRRNEIFFDIETANFEDPDGIRALIFCTVGNSAVRANRASFLLWFNPRVPKTGDDELTASILFNFERYTGPTE